MEKIYPFNEHNKIIFYNKTIFYNGVTKTYTRTVRVDKQWEVRNIVKKNFIQIKNYLRRRSHAVNVSNSFPLIKDSFQSKYTELDFSENKV